MKQFSSEHARWQALVRRDQQADGAFLYGVLTTGVYCRPGCPSRLPKRENVRFFKDDRQAEQAGFRACKRCRPDAPEGKQPQVQAVLKACGLIEKADTEPSLGELADAAGLSPFYFQRVFKKITGVTPKQFAMQKRSNRVQGHLQKKATVTEAVYRAGFGSSSRFYEKASVTLGMKPRIYRNGGPGMLIRFAIYPSCLGLVLAAATSQGICAIEFGDSEEALKKRLRSRFPKAEFEGPNRHFAAMVKKVLAFLEGPRQGGLALPLDILGTAFQHRVWRALQKIPPGSTASYAEIAARIRLPKAVRAVARACAANPVAVAVPCHRVVRGNGALGGYRWGIARKQRLLEQESAGK